MADKQSAAFGFYPHLNRHRAFQDREAAKDMDVAMLRGFVSGVAGMPGDLESIGRLLLNIQGPEQFVMPRSKEEGMAMLGQIFGANRVSLDTALPTSEDIEARLPFKSASETPVGRAVTGASQLAGGFYTGPGSAVRLATGIPKAFVRAGKDFAMAAGQPATRMFIGPKAKTWNQAKADEAARMEKAGVDPVDIWRQTGTFRGADGIPRQEISDQGARFLSDAERGERANLIESQVKELKEKIRPTKQKDLFPRSLTEAKKGVRERINRARDAAWEYKKPPVAGVEAETIIEHPDLYRAYPELAEMKVVSGGYSPDSRGGLSIIPSSRGNPGLMEMDIYERGLRGDPRSTSLHEMQHAVQTIEGMSPGGNITMAFADPRTMEIYNRRMAELKRPSTFEEFQRVNRVPEDRAQTAYEEYLKSHKTSITPAVERMVQEEAAKEYYQRLAGEAEARATQARRDMGPGERAQEYPYASYDVLPEDLLTKPPREYAGGGEVHMQRGGNPLDQYYAPKARPSTGLRRGRSDVDFDVAVPRGLARGFVAGAAGAPGDLEMISRLLANTPGVAAYGQATGAATPGKYREGEVGLQTRLPTSEEIEERLPFRGTSPLERAATGLGMIGGGFYSGPGAPIRAVTAIPSAIGRAGRDFVMAAGQPAVNVVKPKGGNWLDDRLKRELQYLKSPERASGRTPEQEIERYRERLKDPFLTPVNRADVERYLEDEIKESAVDQWVGRNLTNYIKNQMATPEDPVRLMLDKRTAEIETKFAKDLQRAEKLAERAAAEVDPRRKANLTREAEQAKRAAQGERDLAMSHILPTQELTLNAARTAEREAKINRAAEGFPEEGMAKSPAAKAWEDITDSDMGVSANRAVDAQSAIEKKRKAEEALEVFKAKDSEINEAFIKMAAEKGMSPAQIDAINRAFPTRHKLDLLNNSDLTAEYERLSKAAEVQRQTYKDKDLKIAENYPWVERLAPESRLYEFYGSHDLGFNHIIDVLKQDLAAGRITADQLSRMSVDQVIKRAADYDKELAASMNASRAVAREGLPVYKEYPEGYRWVELNRPGAFSSESEAMGHSVRGYEPPKGHPDWVESAGNSGILSYGHGGWEGIKSGRAKVYSLVDPSGNPHVTVEVASNRMQGMSPAQFYQSKDVPKSLLNKIDEAEKAGDLNDIGSLDLLVEYSPEYKAYRESLPSVQNITQIKGKQNAAPNEEYLPFVQDFVRSGQWSDVGDLSNTGLFKVTPGQKLPGFSKEISPGYYSLDDFRKMAAENEMPQDILDSWMGKLQNQSRYGYKSGGSVHISSNPDTMRLELNERRMGAGGFLAKAVKGAQKALPAAEREANLQKFLEPSAVKQRMYHGTQKSFDQFKKNEIGHWFSDSSNVANKYAKSSEEGAQVYPVFLSLKNPLVVANRDEYNAMMEKAWEQGLRGVSELAKRDSHDGVVIKDSGYVNVFEPTQIKSATGNRGTYDVTDPDINKAEGGAISADDLTIEERPL